MITPKRVEAFLEHHGVAYSPRAGNKWILDGCPFNPDHVSTASKPVVVAFRDGLLSFQCFHASCADNHWLEFRKKIEATSGKEKFYFNRPQLPSVAWGGKFHLIPKENKLDPQLLQAAKDYWAGVFDRKTGVSMDGAFTYRAEDINRRLLREGLVLMGSVTKIVRQAYVLFYNFKCLACHEDAHQALEPLRMVYRDTLRRPPTQCPACVAESAQEHDELELDRACEFLQRKIEPGTCAKAIPIGVAAQSIRISNDHLDRARLKLGIQLIAVGRGWMLAWEKGAVGTDDSSFKGWNSRPVSDAVGKQVFEQALEQADDDERREIYLHAHPCAGRKWIAMTRFANELAKVLAVEEDESYVIWAQGWRPLKEVEAAIEKREASR